LPRRIRGVGLGLAVLAAAPLVAAALSSAAAVSGSARLPHPARSGAAEVAVRTVTLPTFQLRLHAPFPPPTPTPTPRPAPPRRPAPHPYVPAAMYPHTAVVADILAAAARYGVSGTWMLHIASCESGLRPNAYNPRGPYYGLFQFLMSTFLHNGGHNIWDPVDQAETAARMLAHGQAHEWSCA
jgi:soluble lytic murein transglycosylase-like protein